MTAPVKIPLERNAQRTRVLMRGTIYSPVGAGTVWIRDISNEGALVTTDLKLSPDAELIFKRGPIFAAALVVRADVAGTALKFYRPLSDEQLTSAQLPLPHRED